MSKISKEELNTQLRAIIEKPAFSGSYADLTNKPTTMTPSTHTHSYNDLTDKPTVALTAAQIEAMNRIPTAEQQTAWTDYLSGSAISSTSALSVQHPPSHYYALKRRTVWENYKDTMLGIPNAGASDWSAVITIVPYQEALEDPLTQVCYSRVGTFTRTSVGTNEATATWGAWSKYSTFSGNFNDLTNKPYEVTTTDRTLWDGLRTGNSMDVAPNVSRTPAYYYELGQRTLWENYPESYLGLPSINTNDWCTLHTIIPWTDVYQDKIVQVAYSPAGTFTRTCIGDTNDEATWTAWQKYSTFSGNYNDLTNKPTGTTYTLPKATPNLLGGIMPDNLTVQVDANGVLKSMPLIKSAKLQTTSITLAANTINQAYNLGTTTVNLLQVTKDAMNRCVVPLTGYYFYSIEVKGILGGTPTGGELTSNLVAGSSTILTTLTPTRNSVNFVDTTVGMSVLSELTTLTLNFSSTLTTPVQSMTVTVNLIALVTV